MSPSHRRISTSTRPAGLPRGLRRRLTPEQRESSIAPSREVFGHGVAQRPVAVEAGVLGEVRPQELPCLTPTLVPAEQERSQPFVGHRLRSGLADPSAILQPPQRRRDAMLAGHALRPVRTVTTSSQAGPGDLHAHPVRVGAIRGRRHRRPINAVPTHPPRSEVRLSPLERSAVSQVSAPAVDLP